MFLIRLLETFKNTRCCMLIWETWVHNLYVKQIGNPILKPRGSIKILYSVVHYYIRRWNWYPSMSGTHCQVVYVYLAHSFSCFIEREKIFICVKCRLPKNIKIQYPYSKCAMNSLKISNIPEKNFLQTGILLNLINHYTFHLWLKRHL